MKTWALGCTMAAEWLDDNAVFAVLTNRPAKLFYLGTKKNE